jgi:hypothetical protein
MTGFESIIGHPGYMYDASHIELQFQRFCPVVVNPLTQDSTTVTHWYTNGLHQRDDGLCIFHQQHNP